jgi:hypothetical protein
MRSHPPKDAMSLAGAVVEAAERPILAEQARALLEELTGEEWKIRRLYRACASQYLPCKRIGTRVRFIESELRDWWARGGTDRKAVEERLAQRKAARRLLRVSASKKQKH